MRARSRRAALVAIVLLALPAAAAAQRPAGPRLPPPPERLAVRAVGLAGVHVFSAGDTFDAVLGSSSGPVFGGGVNVTIPGGVFVQALAWRFSGDGERVFVGAGGQVFPLGIATSVTVTPLEVSAGYRIRGLSRRVQPYVGAGISSYAYEESADFAEGGDDVSERFTGYHVLGGAEVRVSRWVAVAGELAWTTVPDALGEGGASQAFGETDLGGTSVRIKLVIGR